MENVKGTEWTKASAHNLCRPSEFISLGHNCIMLSESHTYMQSSAIYYRQLSAISYYGLVFSTNLWQCIIISLGVQISTNGLKHSRRNFLFFINSMSTSLVWGMRPRLTLLKVKVKPLSLTSCLDSKQQEKGTAQLSRLRSSVQLKYMFWDQSL